MSFIVLLLSIVTGVYGYLSIGGRTFNPPKVSTYKFKWTINPNAALGVICIIGALFGVILAILGFFVQGCKNCCFALPFAILAFIAAIVALAFGAAIVGGGYTDIVRNKICVEGGAKGYLLNHYNTYVDSKMCSKILPAC
jgi:hypothetical protein